MNKKTVFKMMVAATIGSAAIVPYTTASVNAQAGKFADLAQAGAYQEAMTALVKQQVLTGDAKGMLKPGRAITRAELALIMVKAFRIDTNTAGDLAMTDVPADAWYHNAVETLVNKGVLSKDETLFQPRAEVTQEYFTNMLGGVLGKKPAVVQTWMPGGYKADATVSRALTTGLVILAQPHIASPDAAIEKMEALNPITLQVKFSAPLTAEDVSLPQAAKNFAFSQGMTIVNVPQLKTGSVSTYIVPVTVQKPGVTYELSYKGKSAGTFEAKTNKLPMQDAEQVAFDTFEVRSSLEKGITDYGNVVEAYYGNRNGLEMSLNEDNVAGGKAYEVISSLRSRQVTVTPEGGQPIVASYIPYTQATDGRQAPKFKLPEGQSLQPGMKYTIASDWFTMENATFTAKAVEPLKVVSAEPLNETSIAITLAQDPKDEIFSGRSVILADQAGNKITATYKVTTRKVATGVFELQNGAKLASGTPYTVTPANAWASADGIQLQTK
ncbi:hypothetical protein SY83_19650 [Paenibacillus swuensis]|uniref:SLH domain-containing protein n=1 Tax=Paenibacillus swuensis TaxID=1178515 RepID=A0A172TM49_9BACL|nr:S-layer homology domain-containing protein [Paenibacillus swuensis]ANE48135.1 hypothetical protein SY83_19650 [Paenibacillus swuensis]